MGVPGLAGKEWAGVCVLDQGGLWVPRRREELEEDHDSDGRDQAGQ